MIIQQKGKSPLPIYVINLDRDTERLAFVSDQLKALNLPYTRVPAIYGADMPEWLRPYFLDEAGGIASHLTAGEVGCYASHLLVMRMIAESGRPALVLEDDVRISAALPQLLARIDTLPKGWDIVRLSNPANRHIFPVSTFMGDHQVIKFSVVPPGTGASLISPAGASKFLSYRGLRSIPVDQDLRFIWDCGLITYGIHPRPVEPNAFGPSSIATFGSIRQVRYHKMTGWRGRCRRIFFELGWLGLRGWLLTRL